MADSSMGPASFGTQANALLRKNLTFQKRNCCTNCRLISFPIVLCLILALLQGVMNGIANNSKTKCGCSCVDTGRPGQCENICGIEYSTSEQMPKCVVPHPLHWPPVLQIPDSRFRAVRTGFLPYGDLPDESCRKTESCPATLLITGNNQTLGQGVAQNMLPKPPSSNNISDVYFRADAALGSQKRNEDTNFLDPAFSNKLGIIGYIQEQCNLNSSFALTVQLNSAAQRQEVRCERGLLLWRNSSSEIDDEIYKGYAKGNQEHKVNEIVAAYDFSNSNAKLFNVSVWYNATRKDDQPGQPLTLLRVPRAVNLASNAFLKYLVGPNTRMLFEFVKEMPRIPTQTNMDLSATIGALFFTWVILQLFPVFLSALVYEKQHRLRLMMKMHGLGDGPYWMITYAYFFTLSSVYMLFFVIFGAALGIKMFTANSALIQFLFYFLYINLQISSAFLVACLFSDVKTATVVAYILVFGSGLLGNFLFQAFVQDPSFPRAWIIVMELYPGFSLYRGLYEFAQYLQLGDFTNSYGMEWKHLKDPDNGMREILIIIAAEWFVVLGIAYYIDQVVSSGRSPLFLLGIRQKSSSSVQSASLQGQESNKVFAETDKPDVVQEREKVAKLLRDSDTSHAIVCDGLRKIYPGRDGNPEKIAVREISLALPPGECFGMLGTNGAGKTSFISMLIGLTKPTSGTAYIEGMDLRTDMDRIYTCMGVCPQHDLLWENLTGREHLLFYGRLKNFKGAALTQVVEEALKEVGIFHGGVADKKAGQYSGGMKRRLSVAISLIGDPKVVYMDEPSTGLDPVSRNLLWKVVQNAKKKRAIILTTHSMEEAEYLCDRLGIFVDGSLQCVGNSKELKARYGGSYIFTMTTTADHEDDVESLVRSVSQNANKIYQISGTQKFELPKNETRIANVFQAVDSAKSRFPVQAWGLTDTTLEDVFIKVGRGAQAFNVLT